MISVILLMAGKGTRMGADKNKILLPLGDKPVFMHSLETFKSFGFEIVCVISEEDKDEILKYLPNDVKYTIGGKERGDSVYNGIKAVTGDYVLIHDAARPFIAREVIEEIVAKKDNNRAILTYLPVKDTIKIKGDFLKTLKRSELIAAVTPQCGSRMLMLNAYSKALIEKKSFTDDISIVEHYFPKVKIDLVEANEEVFKITTPFDLKVANTIWRDKND
ncbi:MAG: 2-C-methyl-D-erythritol 4-phosphate cytidylyltransferase [Acholeplasmatales bacterium]|nr:2-C-methyl-D-erythritol 4-phosphate cytidylyltransferase [Acholeplasmatales bacterium]